MGKAWIGERKEDLGMGKGKEEKNMRGGSRGGGGEDNIQGEWEL